MTQINDHDVQTITDLHNRWIAHELAGATSKLVDFCTDDTQWMPPDGPPIVGKESVANYLTSMKMELTEIDIMDLSISGTDSFAYLMSNYRTQFLTGGHTGIHEAKGSHLWILQKAGDGDWRIAVLAWSSW